MTLDSDVKTPSNRSFKTSSLTSNRGNLGQSIYKNIEKQDKRP